MVRPLFRIGARGSKLSLAQTGQTRDRWAALMNVPPDAIEIVAITTTGDRIQDRTLVDAGGKGLFTKELDDALLEGRIDLAIHSLKDLPTRLPTGVVLACVPEREDPRDAFVSRQASTLDALQPGALVGTASLRRQAQVLHARPELRVATLRGNVDTRLGKIDAGAFAATFLALAGLRRLGLADRAASLIDPQTMPPAACQGALAVTARADDQRTLDALKPLQDERARLEIEAERAFLTALDGSCRTPIAALARVTAAELRLLGEALTPDGRTRWRREGVVPAAALTVASAQTLGAALGEEIRAEAGGALWAEHA